MEEELRDKAVLNEVVLGYRKVIEGRYKYEELIKKYDLPSSFGKERMDQFRDYFLFYIYPHPDKRAELDNAFASLDNFIRHQDKLLRLVLDSTSLIFKYGRHLPKLLKAGLKALGSFRSASKIEQSLVDIAKASSKTPPYSAETINSFLGQLSYEELKEFVQNTQSLFEIIHDRTLIVKMLEIVDHLILKMRDKPKTYSAIEIRGLEIGRDIIHHGNILFKALSVEDQKKLIELTVQIEKDALDGIFNRAL